MIEIAESGLLVNKRLMQGFLCDKFTRQHEIMDKFYTELNCLLRH